MNGTNETVSLERLDGIETLWSLVRRAHQGTLRSGAEARRELVMRYSAAVRSYVAALTHHDQDTDEISQDVLVRLMDGDFAGADPDRGRFRDLLKVAVRNMVRNHWERQKRRKTVELDVDLLQESDAHADDDPWLRHWRENLMDIAWCSLAAYQQSNPGNLSYDVLKMRADYPDETSDQLAARLSAELGREIRADSYRQQLRRARIRFADFLVAEIAAGLDEPDASRIQDELICLGIYPFIRDVM